MSTGSLGPASLLASYPKARHWAVVLFPDLVEGLPWHHAHSGARALEADRLEPNSSSS